MSPGSYISSESAVESAGSSNSIDDTEIGYGMLLHGTLDTKWANILIWEEKLEFNIYAYSSTLFQF